MRRLYATILAISLPVQWVLIRWIARYPEWVESWYSQGLYLHLSRFFRTLYGWVPFSIGDIVYLALVLALVIVLLRDGIRLRTHFWQSLRAILAALAVLHFTFYLLWGLNYFREPLSEHLGLEESYETAELLALIADLSQEVNALQVELTQDPVKPVKFDLTRREIMEQTLRGYESLSRELPTFTYRRPSLKPSLISGLLSYMGYGGYLNPFTGEAQVNDRLPLFRFPVVCAHEVAHQLGYSAENESNFIGYLVTRNQEDPRLQYSAAAYALAYCLADLSRKDPELSKELASNLNPGVLANYAELQAFWKTYENPMEPVFKAIFNQYLEANLQKDGIGSYNRVVALLVAQHRQESGR